MNRYAQTILQLYAQLSGVGSSEDQLLHVRSAYELAVRLFASQFRANGKPFLAHLVGTASILVRNQAPIPIVIAGLLHAAYLQGEFGDGRVGVTDARRRELCRVVGEEVEKIIVGYTWFVWNHQSVLAMQDNPHALSPEQQDLALIRLANALEDHLDLGMLYSSKRSSTDKGRLLVAVADQLGYHELAQDLAAVYADHETAQIPDVIRTDHTSSYTVVPSSHRRRFSLVLAVWLNKVRRLSKSVSQTAR